MAKKKLENMSLDELGDESVSLDEEIQELRDRKREVQEERDRRAVDQALKGLPDSVRQSLKIDMDSIASVEQFGFERDATGAAVDSEVHEEQVAVAEKIKQNPDSGK